MIGTYSDYYWFLGLVPHGSYSKICRFYVLIMIAKSAHGKQIAFFETVDAIYSMLVIDAKYADDQPYGSSKMLAEQSTGSVTE